MDPGLGQRGSSRNLPPICQFCECTTIFVIFSFSFFLYFFLFFLSFLFYYLNKTIECNIHYKNKLFSFLLFTFFSSSFLSFLSFLYFLSFFSFLFKTYLFIKKQYKATYITKTKCYVRQCSLLCIIATYFFI